MARGPIGVLLIALLCAGLAGCAELKWPAWLNFAPAPPPSRPVQYAPRRSAPPSPAPPPLTETNLPPRRIRKKAAPAATPAPPVAVPTVTLAGAPDQSEHARRTLSRAEEQLRRIDRAKLSAAAAATYDQASGFVEQGQQALKNRDYVAAAGFAAKATMLTGKLRQ